MGFRKKRSPHVVWSAWEAADEARDAGLAAALASELLELTPKSDYSWFQAGLLSKAVGNWPESWSATNGRWNSSLRKMLDIIDTWNMTIDTLPGTVTGRFRVELPGRQFIAVRIRAVS